MNECTNGELRDLLPELVNGRLDAAMRQAVETHVASCAECAEELSLLRSLRPALVREPPIDAQRIAAVVRARTGGPARLQQPRSRIPTRWRLAIAAASLLAVSALGYELRSRRAIRAEEVAAVPATRNAARDTTSRVSAAHEPVRPTKSTSPRAAPQQMAVAPSSPRTRANTGVLDNVADLSDDDVRALTASLDGLSSVPDADPSPGIDPLGATLDELSSGGK
jgi:anti-sigma factor RsiW